MSRLFLMRYPSYHRQSGGETPAIGHDPEAEDLRLFAAIVGLARSLASSRSSFPRAFIA
jgi:hypothetical protein